MRSARRLIATLALPIAIACSPSPAADERPAPSAPRRARRPRLDRLGVGSQRRAASGGAPSRAAPRSSSPPDEPGRDHCCAHLSPDGGWVVYLSLPGGRQVLAAGDGRRAAPHPHRRRPRSRARPRRAPLRRAPRRALVARGRAGLHRRGRRHAAGATSRAAPSARSPTGRSAARDSSSNRRGGGRPLRPRPSPRSIPRPARCSWRRRTAAARPGWPPTAPPASGPPAPAGRSTRSTSPRARTWTVLSKHDPPLPRDRGYLYFPMLSRDRTLLAFAGSNDDHDHFRADYDVFLMELDPTSLLPVGDRCASLPTRRSTAIRTSGAIRPSRAAAETARGAAAPTPRRPLPERWPTFAGARLDLGGGGPAQPPRAQRGERDPRRTWRDLGRPARPARARRRRRRGACRERAPRRRRAARHEHRHAGAGGRARVARERCRRADPRAGGGPRQRGLLLTQAGDRIELRDAHQRDPSRRGRAGAARAPAGRGPHHVAFTYSPGRLRTYLDGQPAEAPAWCGDFYPWRSGALTLGAEGGGAGAFRGSLSHLAIFARELGADEIAADAQRALGSARRRAAGRGARDRGRARSRARACPHSTRSRPTGARWWSSAGGSSASWPGGPASDRRLRVARWAILDGGRRDASALAPARAPGCGSSPTTRSRSSRASSSSSTSPRRAGRRSTTATWRRHGSGSTSVRRAGAERVVFSSHLFLFGFLPLALALYYLAPRRARNLVVTLTSCVFYGWANPIYLLLLLATTASTSGPAWCRPPSAGGRSASSRAPLVPGGPRSRDPARGARGLDRLEPRRCSPSSSTSTSASRQLERGRRRRLGLGMAPHRQRAARGAAARHQLLHLRGDELLDRRLPRPGAADAQLRRLRLLRLDVAAARRRTDRALHRDRRPARRPPRTRSPRFARGVGVLRRRAGEEGAAREPVRQDRRHRVRRRVVDHARRLVRARRLRVPDLLRLLRLLGHGDRARPDARLRLPQELRRALPLALDHRVLAALAHLALDLAARLPLRPAGRQPQGAAADLRQPRAS